jgi:hypothetical protein
LNYSGDLCGVIKMCGKFTFFINLSAGAISTGHTNIVSRAERLRSTLRAAVQAITLSFYFSSFGITAILANKRITCALLFVFVQPIDL